MYYGTLTNRGKQIIAYSKIREKNVVFKTVVQKCEEIELKINVEKTKIMRFGRERTEEKVKESDYLILK